MNSVVRFALPALAVLALGATQVARADIFDKLRGAKDVLGTAAKLSDRIDENQERSIGRAVAANLIARFGLVHDRRVTTYLTTLGTYLANYSARPELPYRFAVLDTDEVHAFAAPGGYVFVSRGMLGAIEDESELAGVLAHEILHVSERHGVKTIEDSYRKKVVLEGLTKAAARRSGADPALVSAFGELTDELTDTLLSKGLSRKLELDADRGALDLVAAAGYDPDGLARFLDRLAAEHVPASRLKTMSRTHPAPADRSAALVAAMTEAQLAPREDSRWPELYVAATSSLR